MEEQYLIPANSKKSLLIFGLFVWFDLIMFGIGLALTLILLMVLPLDNITFTVIALAPAFITGFLVMPVPNYYNMRTILTSAFTFLTTRQKFVWKGWGILEYDREKEKQVHD